MKPDSRRWCVFCCALTYASKLSKIDKQGKAMEVMCCFPQSHSRNAQEQNHNPSIDFDCAVNPSNERIRCEKSDGTHQEAVDGASETRVREEEHSVCEAGDVELGGEVIARVGEDPEGRGGSKEERLPGPVVILLEIS